MTLLQTHSDWKFHHIGVACYDIEKTFAHYESIGYMKNDIIFDPLQNIKICFLIHVKNLPCIELLAPVDCNSPVWGTLKKIGVGPYHICYAVPNIEEAIKKLRDNKYLLVSKPKPACAIENREVAFLYHNDVGLIEILEDK